MARPTLRTLAASILLVAPGLWLRAYASGYVKKNAELARTGPYAHTRNPLYLGSMLIAFGFAVASASWMIFALLAALFAAIYIPTILGEETYLRQHFAGFEAYAQAVPRLVPRLTAARFAAEDEGGQQERKRGGFSVALYRQHREYNSLMGACAIYLALALRYMAQQHMLLAGFSRPPWWP